MSQYVLAIDQGTTNSRAIIFDQSGKVMSCHEMPLLQRYPLDGWVEQDPDEIFNNTLTCCQMALQKTYLTVSDIKAIGISNQRETTIIWDKQTGRAIYPAIVWQDRRTADWCREMSKSISIDTLQQKTGLLFDPYFSASKIVWILQNVPNAQERAKRGELLFGTVDTFLIWRLTKGKSHLTDVTNASRTLLFNLKTQDWDDELLTLFDIPRLLLPEIRDNTSDFGLVDAALLGKPVMIAASVGDQQAATVGQACFQKGMVKATYGTGCFVLLNTGDEMILSKHNMLSTIAYKINNKVTYGLEGSIFSAGATVKWLRDSLELISSAQETEQLASSIDSTEGVYLIPAFTGLGAPHWDPDARGAILGLSRNSGKAHIVRAALESVAYQTRDLLEVMQHDSNTELATLRVDGGMVANNWLIQFLADMLQLSVQRPACIETSALGAAYLAGLQVGIYSSLEEIGANWQMDSEYVPQMSVDEVKRLNRGWQLALTKVLS